MKYTNAKPELNDNQNLGILIINLGTPDAPNRKSLRKYLKEFLSDPRVVETTFPRWLWLLILNVIILNVRPAKSAKLYNKIWQDFGNGSPLLDISKKQLIAIKHQLAASSFGKFEIELGMRYGNPSIPSAMNRLKQKGMGKLIVLPLYPQYSASTTASAMDAVTTELQQWRFVPEIKFINQYHREPLYITALIKSIQRHWLKNGKPEKLLVSFHGIPKS
ncbi:MAG: ferrochelatase [Proteobacteria bacterium]|nr:ferrochelatase [Pseudomonadota bacterium]